MVFELNRRGDRIIDSVFHEDVFDSFCSDEWGWLGSWLADHIFKNEVIIINERLLIIHTNVPKNGFYKDAEGFYMNPCTETFTKVNLEPSDKRTLKN